MFENHDVFAEGRPHQPLLAWHRRKGGLQSADRSKIKIGIPPLQEANGLEAVTFEGLDKFRVERIAASSRAKGAVVHCTAGPAGDLGKFGRIELSELIAVEFPIGRKGDMVDVEIEAHPYGIGRDQVIDIAR